MRTSKKIAPKTKPIFSFVIDGECEYWYLQMLKDNEKSLKINLLPEIYKKKTLDKQYKRVVELAKESAKVFWVIDFDIINKETKEAKSGQKTELQKFKEFAQKLNRYENVEVVVNNPCFEFWVLLHFIFTAKYYENYKALLPDLQKHLETYGKTEKFFTQTNPDIYKRLLPHLQTAISNSEKLGDFDFENYQRGISEMNKVFNELGLEK